MTKNSRFTEIFEDYFRKSRNRYFKLNNAIWYDYNRAIVPVGPAKFDYRLSESQSKQLLSMFPKTLFIRSNNGFQELSSSQSPLWYSVIKNTFLDRENIKSYEARKKIKRGLEFCTVERVDADFIAKKGYDILYAAVKSYKGRVKIFTDEKGFTQRNKARNFYPEIFHYWGVFHNSKLIGYAENLIFDTIEASYSTMKFLPEKFSLFPTYALVYSMDEYYLKKNNFEYVNDGFRNILHDTNIQEFLIKNFNFFKQPTKLYLYYKPIINLIVRTVYPFRNLIASDKLILPKVKAMIKLEEVRRNYSAIKKLN